MKSKPCVHFWLVEEADGETSKGRCKYCKATREFIANIFDIAPKDYKDNVQVGRMAVEAIKMGRHNMRRTS